MPEAAEKPTIVSVLADYVETDNAMQRELVRRWIDQGGPAEERPDRVKIIGGLFAALYRPRWHRGEEFSKLIRMSPRKAETLVRDLYRAVYRAPDPEQQIAVAAGFLDD
jgi:hypothetical protein